MNAPPRVSVVVPAFNEPEAVLQESLASMRAQTFADFECLLVDESTDPSRAAACRAECAKDGRFRYLRPAQRIGLAASLNLGLDAARGAYIARFDSDDLAMPERLAAQVAFLDANPGVAVVGSALEVIGDDGAHAAWRRYPTTHHAIERAMQTTNALAHPTVMYRRSAVVAHGRYDPAFRYSEDLELWLRWLAAGLVFANLPQPLVRYRQKLTRRNREHWRCNLRARVRHLGSRHLVRRLAGIAAVGAWMLVPARLQEHAYRKLMLRKTAPQVST